MPAQINPPAIPIAEDTQSPFLAPEALIAKRASKFDIGKFVNGYEVAVKELVEAKINHLPVPKDEAPKATSCRVVSLMDALRKSMEPDPKAKKPVASEKDSRKGIGLVKTPAKAPKRKSA